MNILEIRNLKKCYHNGDTELNVLDNLSFDVEQGELLAIIGTSGCGKSTLLHILGGVDTADAGHILMNDQDITQFNSKELATYRRKDVSIIYQFYNLISVINVLDNIILPLKLDNRKIDCDYLNTLLEILELSDKKNNFPSQLSGGQQQRVAIARAMITKPKVILADEPTGNLDSHNSKIIIQQLKKLHLMHNTTIIIVTHDLELAKHCNRIAILKNGKLDKYETR